MQINPSIFKGYDIRGVYPTELNEEVLIPIVKAIYTFFHKSKEKNKPLTIVVGTDMRISSPSLTKVAIDTLVKLGAHIIDIGVVSTPTFYFAVSHYNYECGFQITASHNPKEWNGIKMVKNSSKGLIKIGKTSPESLLSPLKNEDRQVRESVASILGKLKYTGAIEPLIEALNDEDIYKTAETSLLETGEPAVEPLIGALKREDKKIRERSAYLLGEMKDKRAIKPLMELFKDKDENIHRITGIALEKLGEPVKCKKHPKELLVWGPNLKDEDDWIIEWTGTLPEKFICPKDLEEEAVEKVKKEISEIVNNSRKASPPNISGGLPDKAKGHLALVVYVGRGGSDDEYWRGRFGKKLAELLVEHSLMGNKQQEQGRFQRGYCNGIGYEPTGERLFELEKGGDNAWSAWGFTSDTKYALVVTYVYAWYYVYQEYYALADGSEVKPTEVDVEAVLYNVKSGEPVYFLSGSGRYSPDTLSPPKDAFVTSYEDLKIVMQEELNSKSEKIAAEQIIKQLKK